MTDTPDPVTPEPAPPPAPRRYPLLPLLAGGALAAALGFGAALYLPRTQTDTSALQAQLEAQAAELATLKSQLTELPAADKSLSDRLATLESAPPPPAAPDLTPRLDALEAALAARPTQTGPSDPVALAAIQLQIDALKQGTIPAAAIAEAEAALDAKLAEADTRLAAVTAEAEAIAQTAARKTALRQLETALDTGEPYASALATLTDLTLPPVLTEHDAAGLPTLQALRSSFPDAARAALDAALKANMGESWTERVANFLQGQTGARSLTPREGNDPDAILSRAEAAIATGDLTTALTEIGALPPEAQAAMEQWLTEARLRRDASLAVQTLLSANGM